MNPPTAAQRAAQLTTRATRTTCTTRSAGFTLVELVMVMGVIGAMAVFVVPRALDLTDWRLRAFGDELQSQSMAMQRLALAQRRPVVATVTPTGVSFAYAAGGTLATLPCPAAASPCISEAGTRTVTFNAANSGRAVTSTGAALPVTVASGGWSRGYRIEAETGLIRPVP
jgi:prepilin-type N-terminal cleavage/methylation domain-containing protein